jgi:aldose 1-epimerase
MTTRTPFGTHEGRAVEAVTLTGARGMRARLITYGARLTELWVPGRDGELADIVLGFDNLDAYVATDTFFGATCGRYGNRIRKGQFTLDGTPIQVDCNEHGNHLHGGVAGFDRKVWEIAELTPSRAVFTAVSDAGEMGFPGRSNLRTTYELTDDGLSIVMEADTDAPTLMNIVHHSYFNMAGQGSGDVLGQQLRLASEFYTPVDDELLATGEVLSVKGTPFDFSAAKPIGRDIDTLTAVGAEIFGEGGGYDHNWCLSAAGERLRDCAEAWDPASGRKMRLSTTEPGVQFYTGGYLSSAIEGKAGARLCKYAGFTLETQKFPGSPNFGHFPSSRLDPGETYRQEMHFRFSTCSADGDDL